jgi:hypothetical protein
MSEIVQPPDVRAVVIEVATPPVLVEGGGQHLLTHEQPVTVLVTVGIQGPPGRPGAGGAEWQANEW